MALPVVFNQDRGNAADIGEDAQPGIPGAENKLAGLPGVVGNGNRVNENL